jgi:tRNA (Thr-GGU) A37 N-methylase
VADYVLRPIGVVRSPLGDRSAAPRQPDEGAPPAEVVLDESVVPALAGIEVGDRLELLTWLHLGDRSTLTTYPRNDTSRPLAGVFATRSPDSSATASGRSRSDPQTNRCGVYGLR